MNYENLKGLGDILVDRTLTAEEARLALSAALSLRQEDVWVFENLQDIVNAPPDAAVRCLMTVLPAGEFRTLLSPFEKISEAFNRIPMVAGLCRAVGCRCLVDDGCADPFTFLLVDGCGTGRQVSIDPAKADEKTYDIVPEK